MNTPVKVVLIVGGIAAFYAMRKYADKKFAAQTGTETTAPPAPPTDTTATAPASNVDKAIEFLKNVLPGDILPAPTPTRTFTPLYPNGVISTAPVVKSTVPVSYPVNKLSYKTYSTNPRLPSMAGINLR